MFRQKAIILGVLLLGCLSMTEIGYAATINALVARMHLLAEVGSSSVTHVWPVNAYVYCTSNGVDIKAY